MSSYDRDRYTPPAPVAEVSWRLLDDPARTTGAVSMLLDTGADVTLVPRRVAEELDAPVVEDRQYQLVGYDGRVDLYSAVSLELILGNRAFRGRFLVIDREVGVLGRNVLNRMRILFDGPRQIWELRTPQRPAQV